MSELHVYDNDYDWVCASSPEDALIVWCEYIGEKPGDYRDMLFRELPDDKLIGFWCDQDGAISEEGDRSARVVRLPAREWALRFGRAYLGGSDH